MGDNKISELLKDAFTTLFLALFVIATMPTVMEHPLMSHDEKLLIIGLLYGFVWGLLGNPIIRLFWDSMHVVTLILKTRVGKYAR